MAVPPITYMFPKCRSTTKNVGHQHRGLWPKPLFAAHSGSKSTTRCSRIPYIHQITNHHYRTPVWRFVCVTKHDFIHTCIQNIHTYIHLFHHYTSRPQPCGRSHNKSVRTDNIKWVNIILTYEHSRVLLFVFFVCVGTSAHVCRHANDCSHTTPYFTAATLRHLIMTKTNCVCVRVHISINQNPKTYANNESMISTSVCMLVFSSSVFINTHLLLTIVATIGANDFIDIYHYYTSGGVL